LQPRQSCRLLLLWSEYIWKYFLKKLVLLEKSLYLFFEFSIFNRYRIYRTAIFALYVKVIDIPKCMRSEISIFSAFLTIYEGHTNNIEIVLYQGRSGKRAA
jgi:hypothetical protein